MGCILDLLLKVLLTIYVQLFECPAVRYPSIIMAVKNGWSQITTMHAYTTVPPNLAIISSKSASVIATFISLHTVLMSSLLMAPDLVT